MTDTKKHTPTPWYMEPIEPKYFPSIVLAPKGVSLKYCDGSGSTKSILQRRRVTINSGLDADDFLRGVASNTMETCIANAAFIIEAVNSHEALKAALRLVVLESERAEPVHGVWADRNRCKAFGDIARAALAKVKP